MTSRIVQLGFEVDTQIPIAIPIRHMAVTGQTQESGKTTTLEALISRSGLAGIAFLTKRGESSFTSARHVLPYFHDRADWRFVQSILESAMHERMKFERAWIVRACKGARTLADVQRNVVTLEETARNALSRDVYMLLGEYLQTVVPLIASLPKTHKVDLHVGEFVVMDLVSYPQELQMLVISSTLEWLYRNVSRVITIVPEAWKFIPQGKNSPVKMVAEKLIREGASLGNYLWIDSQDMAAVDKMMLRACAVWLIGVQREANEIKRALSNMPAGLKKPKTEAVATLQLGQFYACYGSEIRKTYVQPAWMDETVAGQIAAGRLSVHDLAVTAKSQGKASDHLLGLTERQDSTKAKEPVTHGGPGKGRVESPAGSAARSHSPAREAVPQTIAQQEEEMPDQETLAAIRLAIKDGARDTALQLFDSLYGPPQEEKPHSPRSYTPAETFDNEQLYQAFKKRLMEEAPALVKVMSQRPEIQVQTQRRTVTMNDDTIKGRLAMLIHEGWLDQPRGGSEVYKELIRRGLASKTPNIRVYEALSDFRSMGFFYVSEDKKYSLAPGAKVNVVAA